ncbi:unnamed protein product [Brassica napus]|uniref:(rape) hypothetical protein n=1 Tax=Brassica napus TaxID=3708 RepID=A0A816V1X6_BRANA|nr:unnamed protein product [Brassica napus]
MHVELAQNHRPTDIEIWLRVAVERGVRKLRFHNNPFGPKEAIRLPGSLYTCQTLVSLTLLYTFIVDVPLTICFPSLKTLRLRRVEFSNDEIVPTILSGCPVLEGLAITRVNNGNMKTFTIMVPSLLRLTVLDLKSGSQVPGDDIGLMIAAPSLTSLTVFSQVSCSLVNMPSLVKAYIKLSSPGDSKKLLQFLTSAKHLSLCAIPSTFSYPIGVFYHLVSLVLCTCCSVWFCLILRQTPKLRILRFRPIERCFDYVQIQWEQTSSVP